MRVRLFTGVVVTAICLALLGAGMAAAASQRYSGKTDQGLKLRAQVRGDRIVLVRVKVRLRCRDGGLLFDDLSDFEPARLEKGTGRFADVQYGATDVVRWRGRVTEKAVRGTIRVKDKLPNGVRCDSGNVGFVARG